MKRIAITIDLRNDIWSNGINQNAIYLANLLKEIGYDAYLVHPLNEEIEEASGIKTISLKKAYHVPFSLIIQLGFTISNNMFNIFKQKNKMLKLVAYMCGNDYITDMESILFDSNKKRVDSYNPNDPDAMPHQVWSIPQMEKTNLQYYSFLTKQQKATVVPFIWEPLSIEKYCQDNGHTTYTKRNLNRIAVMEPNISVMKNILLPIAILEKYYNKSKNIISVLLIGANIIKTNKRLLQILSNTKIHKDNRVSAEDRMKTVGLLNKYVDVVLSCQWENNLNYLWLDVAWLGWPIIHNGSMCQDIGYYYPEFDINQGALKLEEAITNHNNDLEYLERNRKIIKRYTHKNEKLKEQYKTLIENVLNNRFEKYSYDWQTNTIKI